MNARVAPLAAGAVLGALHVERCSKYLREAIRDHEAAKWSRDGRLISATRRRLVIEVSRFTFGGFAVSILLLGKMQLGA